MDLKDEEQVQLATVDQQNQIVREENTEETEINTKMADSKSSPLKIIIIVVITLIILCGVAVLIWYLTTLKESNSKTNDAELEEIQNWSENLILSTNIDSTGLEHGIIYKQLNLSIQDNGINRINFNQFYEYNGPIGYSKTWLNAQSRTVYNYALAYEHRKDERFLYYAVNGINAIFNYFYDNVYGGYYRSIILYDNGTLIIDNPTKDVAQHQFLLKALSKLYQVTLNETYLNKAVEVYDILCTDFTDSTDVGLYGTLTRNFANVTSMGKSSGIMLGFLHSLFDLYETYKMYNDINNGEKAGMLVLLETKANEIYEFMMDLRVDVTVWNDNNAKQTYKVICLNNDDQWEPDSSMLVIDNILAADTFKLSLYIWKFMDLGVISKTDENILNVNQLFEYSIALSFDDKTGSLAFKYYNTTLGWYWWHSTQWWMGIEALRTVVYYNYNSLYEDQKYIQGLQRKALNWFNDTFYDPKYGGLYASADDYNKGGEWKVGYHTIEATFTILDIQGYFAN
eukprot:251106_1